MYFVDFANNLMKESNKGVLIYLILNTILVVAIFSNGFASGSGMLLGLVVYVASLAIALSPVGEWILRMQTGCKAIKRKEYLERLEPLFQEVYQKARELDPSIPDGVKLFMSNDKEPNAFATGRKTICLTKGFLDYSDEEIKATLAHEFGHLSHKDTDLILVVVVGNFIVTAFFVIYRGIANAIGFIASLASNNFGPFIISVLIDLILAAMMWIWTKIGTMLVMHSSRKNEFLADEFAYNLGYGNSLCSVLDSFEPSDSKGLWANLSSSHPESDDRIANLQELGVSYRKEA